MIAKLLLKNGTILEGISVGANGTAFGEICATSASTGYQEILTDPSFTQQIVVMTYPEIGNYGINSENIENERIFPSALVMKNYCEEESHYKSKQKLSSYLKENNIIAISGVDTRYIATLIREEGSMPCLVTTEEITEELKNELSNWQPDKDIVKKASKNEKYRIKGSKHKIAIIDLGLKNSILQNLIDLDCDIYVYPPDISAKELLENTPDAVLLSNGPGNPLDAKETIATTKEILKKVPLYGIGLGCQILGILTGAKIKKLKFGHFGNNYPIMDVMTQKVILTTQNHRYTIDMNSLPENAFATHQNLNDATLEGFCCPALSIEAIQFHPEVTATQTDATGVFARWMEQIEGFKICRNIQI